MKWNKSFRLVFLWIVFVTVLIGIRFKSYFFVPIPLWYDWGMYRDFMFASFNFLPHIRLDGFAPWIQQIYEPWLWLLTNIPLLFWYSVDRILLWWVWLLSIITSFFIYLALKKYGKYAGYIGMLLFWVSIIQYQTFWRGYLKQIIGIILMLSIFSIFDRKKYRLSLPLLIMLIVINRPGGIFFLAVFGVWQLISWVRTKTIDTKSISVIVWWLLLAFPIYYSVFHLQVMAMLPPLFSSIFIESTSWTFFSLHGFIGYDIFFLLLSLRGVALEIKKKNRDWMFVWWIVWFSRFFLWLFFYSRVAIYRDIFIILLAARGLSDLYKQRKALFLWIFRPFFILQSVWYLFYVNAMSFPLIGQVELVNIQKIGNTISSKSILMVTNKKYSAFVQGWTNNAIIAPWLFDLDKRNQVQWDDRHQWDWAKKCSMMQDYKNLQQSIYLRIGKNQPVENFVGQNCFDVIENEWTSLLLKWTP